MEESAPSEWGYAPSEASVEWSVATAEGFDRASVANFSSAASEFDEFRFLQAEHDRFAAAVSGAAAAASSKKKGTAGAGGGLLMSCRCEKAVSVGPNPVRFVPDQRRPVGVPVYLDEPDRASGLGLGLARLGNTNQVRCQSARLSRPVVTR
nr:unnamed protein product [Ananas comosus var. bracteatus]